MNQNAFSYKLSWEMVAMNDAGNATPQARLALEIALGVANANDNPTFSHIMECIIAQVSDEDVKRRLFIYGNRAMNAK